MHEEDLACQTGRGDHLLQEEENQVVDRVHGRALYRIGKQDLFPYLDHRVLASRRGGHRGVGPEERVVPVSQQMVPHALEPHLRNREGDRLGSVEHPVPAFRHHGRGGVLDGKVVVPLRVGGGAPGRVDVHLPGVRVALEHGELARGQFVCVLGRIRCGDREQDLVARKGVDLPRAFFVAFRQLRDAPFPGGDRPVLVRLRVRPQRREGSVRELLGFLCRDLRLDRTVAARSTARMNVQCSNPGYGFVHVSISSRSSCPVRSGP